MNEEQKKLKDFIDKRNFLLNEVAELKQQIRLKTELGLKLEGAIEAFGILGIELPGDTDDSRS